MKFSFFHIKTTFCRIIYFFIYTKSFEQSFIRNKILTKSFEKSFIRNKSRIELNCQKNYVMNICKITWKYTLLLFIFFNYYLIKWVYFIHIIYFLCRYEDLTDPEKMRKDKKCDRTVSLYGYMRGAHLKYNSKIHVIGTVMRLSIFFIFIMKYIYIIMCIH